MNLKSKKFIAYIIAELGWKLILFYVLYQYSSKIEHYSFMLLLGIVITSGFIQVGYILGQAALDRYALMAENTTKSLRENSNDKDS